MESKIRKGEGNEDLPLVSVIMPVRNEEGHILESLTTVLNQDYPPDRLEIIVSDGMSTDRTRDIVRSIQSEHPVVRLIDNPERIVPTGLNRGIQAAKGEVIVRMDGHALFASDFLKQNIRLLREHPEAWSVGGPIVHTARTLFGQAVAAAMSHPLGVGNARHRFGDYEGYAEGAAFPALRRWVFDRIGMFDERLVRNQDDEFNFRIAEAGGKIFVTPKVKYRYFVRESPRQLFRQYFQYAFWRIPVIEKHRRPTTARQILPLMFFVLMACLLVAGLASGMPIVALFLPVCYASVLILVAAGMVPSLGPGVATRVPIAMAILHSAYAAGMAYGVWARLFDHDAWEVQGEMAKISR